MAGFHSVHPKADHKRPINLINQPNFNITHSLWALIAPWVGTTPTGLHEALENVEITSDSLGWFCD